MKPGDHVILDDGDAPWRTHCTVKRVLPGGYRAVVHFAPLDAWLIVPTHRLTPTEDAT